MLKKKESPHHVFLSLVRAKKKYIKVNKVKSLKLKKIFVCKARNN